MLPGRAWRLISSHWAPSYVVVALQGQRSDPEAPQLPHRSQSGDGGIRAPFGIAAYAATSRKTIAPLVGADWGVDPADRLCLWPENVAPPIN